MKITGKETFAEVISKHPEAVEVFLNFGMGCAMCGLAGSETIEQGAEAHGIDVKKLLNALNRKVQKK